MSITIWILCTLVALCRGQSVTAGDCRDDDFVPRLPKFVGDPCGVDKDCINPINQGYVCRNGACACGPSFAEIPSLMGNRSICARRPGSSYLGQQCTGVCAFPYSCAAGLNPPTPTPSSSVLPTPSPPTVAIMPMIALPLNKCECQPPFKYISYRCQKECQADEVQLPNGDCRKKCGLDEIVDENNQCKKIAELDQPCQTDLQCVSAYSQCRDGACKCLDGFEAKDGKCDHTAYYCSIGEVVRQANGSITACKVIRSKVLAGPAKSAPYGSYGSLSYKRPDGLEDTCGEGKWCQTLIPTGPAQESENDEGFCCTKPKPACPIGQPYAPAPYCSDPIYWSAETQGKLTSDSCPKNYECVPTGTPDRPVCCPRTCVPGQIYVRGKCYQKRQYGQPCHVDEQCRGHTGVCVQGQCKCAPKFIINGANKPENERSCYRDCAYDEVSNGRGECVPRIKLGQTCKNSGQCPRDAYCNNKGVCACRCGFKQYSDAFCGPTPICRYTNSTASPSDPPVFCKAVPDTVTPFLSIQVAAQCPGEQVCMSYRPGAGLCCPKPPDFSCPVNSTFQGPCSPRSSRACNGSAQCIMPYAAANSSDHTGGICCLRNPIPTTTTTRTTTQPRSSTPSGSSTTPRPATPTSSQNPSQTPGTSPTATPTPTRTVTPAPTTTATPGSTATPISAVPTTVTQTPTVLPTTGTSPK